MSKTCGLTDRELDIWVAEHVMGWTTEGSHHSNPDEWEGWRDPEGQQGYCSVTEYTQSLDVCAQAEAKIQEMGLLFDYIRALVVPTHGGTLQTSDWLLITATARQRCEAMWLIRNAINAAHVVS